MGNCGLGNALERLNLDRIMEKSRVFEMHEGFQKLCVGGVRTANGRVHIPGKRFAVIRHLSSQKWIREITTRMVLR